MTVKEAILATARRLAIETGTVPSLDTIASAAAVSKGGLTHHFKTRSALLVSLTDQAIARMDDALHRAAATGDVARIWLQRSMNREEADFYRALLMSFADVGPGASELLQKSAEASVRWEGLLADELNDPLAASMVRLIGDGLVMNALTGDTALTLEAILQWVHRKQEKP